MPASPAFPTSFAPALLGHALLAHAQAVLTPTLRAGALQPTHSIDGRLDEPAWATAEVIDLFTQADPRERRTGHGSHRRSRAGRAEGARHRHRLRATARLGRGELQCAT